MDNRYEIADEHGMSHEFIDWFFDKKKESSGNLWVVMMSAMWEGYKAREALPTISIDFGLEQEKFEAWWERHHETKPLSGWQQLRSEDGYVDEDIDRQWDAWKGKATDV